jgi:hypothetical protein
MRKSIKKYTMPLIFKNKIALLLCILCLLDAAFTDIGLRNKFIDELNPLMAYFYSQDIKLFYMFKLGLPTALIYLLYKFKIRKRITNTLLYVNILYTCILALHIRWLIFYFYS